MWRKRLGIAALAISFASILSQHVRVETTLQVSATPARINLSTPTPVPTQQVYTETATRTPTPTGLVVLEANTEANVRAQPDPESERLGTIRSGEVYTVLGRYYRWLQFQYDPSPNGKGWVFDELVTLTGDTSSLPDLAEQDIPTIDPTLLGVTETLQVVTLTPGGILTSTANARIIPAPASGGEENNADSIAGGNNTVVLPTFTYPADITTPNPGASVQAAPTTAPNPTELVNTVNSELPPIVPILVLGGLGLLGLIISSLRR